jgi:hypothetical protein
VFCSLGKVISIGQLSVDISDCSIKLLRKKLSVICLKKQNFIKQEFDFEPLIEELNLIKPCFVALLAINNKSENYKTPDFGVSFNKSPLLHVPKGFCICKFLIINNNIK